MFALEVEYLLGRAFATNFGDNSEPEWPPAPARMFSAMAAAYFENGLDTREKDALEWLERCGPPHIRAGEPGKSAKFQAFVPTNYIGDQVPALRGKQPRFFPAQAPSDERVSFVWPEHNPDATVRAALESLADRTTALGRACSLVWMRVLEAPEGEDTYIPDEHGKHILRVPAPGRLEELRQLYSANRRPTAGALVPYRKRYERVEAEKLQATEFAHIIFLKRTGGPGLPIDAALTLTDASRAALISLAGSSGPVTDLLHGHGDRTHCAIIAVPFAGAKYGDGHLLGIGVVVPEGATPNERREIVSVCAQLAERGLHIPGIGDWELEPVDAFSPVVQLRPTTWTGPANKWASVTPILLDRFPKKKGPMVEDILATACRRIGLPKPIDIHHSPYSALPGVPPVPAFRLQRKSGERPRWGVHATLTFDQPVRGPVLLGAGRYFGLGLLRPLERKDRA
jgi:CRISPR-associated protein Csb2